MSLNGLLFISQQDGIFHRMGVVGGAEAGPGEAEMGVEGEGGVVPCPDFELDLRRSGAGAGFYGGVAEGGGDALTTGGRDDGEVFDLGFDFFSSSQQLQDDTSKEIFFGGFFFFCDENPALQWG